MDARPGIIRDVGISTGGCRRNRRRLTPKWIWVKSSRKTRGRRPGWIDDPGTVSEGHFRLQPTLAGPWVGRGYSPGSVGATAVGADSFVSPPAAVLRGVRRLVEPRGRPRPRRGALPAPSALSPAGAPSTGTTSAGTAFAGTKARLGCASSDTTATGATGSNSTG
jgi:hypothetical protein